MGIRRQYGTDWAGIANEISIEDGQLRKFFDCKLGKSAKNAEGSSVHKFLLELQSLSEKCPLLREKLELLHTYKVLGLKSYAYR